MVYPAEAQHSKEKLMRDIFLSSTSEFGVREKVIEPHKTPGSCRGRVIYL
jgi:hypothetical protein